MEKETINMILLAFVLLTMLSLLGYLVYKGEVLLDTPCQVCVNQNPDVRCAEITPFQKVINKVINDSKGN